MNTLRYRLHRLENRITPRTGDGPSLAEIIRDRRRLRREREGLPFEEISEWDRRNMPGHGDWAD